MPTLVDIYHYLPYPLKVIAASARGYYLRAWRYTTETERLVQAALEREGWPYSKWKSWQEERLAYLLHRAATQVPYYQKVWSKRRRQGDQAAWDILENWPVLEKETLRQNAPEFVATDCNIRRMYHEHTSGTTGKPLDLWWSKDTVRQWFALFEARCRRWYGVSRDDRWAIIGGQLITPVRQKQPPYWVWNAGLNQLYLSAYHLKPENIAAYREAIDRYQIQYLLGYPSALYTLANEMLHLGLPVLSVKVAVANAEPVYDYQRQAIEGAFGCPLRETYGMAEIVAAASQCEQGSHHLWPEAGIVELLDDSNQAVPPGRHGSLICTGLLNCDMPLIRYRVGDSGSTAPPHQTCNCKRTLPLLSSVEGRSDDLLVTPDGRRIGRLDPVFKNTSQIKEAQIIQEARDRLRVRLVTDRDFNTRSEKNMVHNLLARFGSVEVIVEKVAQIPREANGKFRAVICLLSEKDKSG